MENNLSLNATPLFGYFCVEQPDGTERILVDHAGTGNQWQFPIKGEVTTKDTSPDQAVSNAVSKLVDDQRIIGRNELQLSGMFPFQLNLVRLAPDLSPAYFVKARIQKEISTSTKRFGWVDKSRQFTKLGSSCLDQSYFDAIHEEKAYFQAGFRVLDCVDMLVFRITKGEVEFLMLKREDRTLSVVGWEYSKGPLLYHETHREAAARELREETGLDVSNYVYIRDLGFQTVNVAWRKKSYDTLHLLALTYLFTGHEDKIVPYKKEGLRVSTWMKWEEAREKIWMRDYGPIFFDRWKEREAEILKNL